MANIIGYDVDLDTMKSSTCGKIGIAKKDGKRYFCKVFNDPVEPTNNGALSARAIAKNQAIFDVFKRRKTKLNRILREISGLGGNIVYPIDETVYEHHWTEFSEYIEGALPEDRYSTVISGLDKDEKMLVLKIAIGALQTIHGQRIVHGDLKLTNIMLVKNAKGHYVSKIIDFDGAFFEDDVPLDSITGTVDYYSPELALYSSNEDPDFREKISKIITIKSDIFTMGLILHEYLSGSKPKPDQWSSSLKKLESAGKFIYPWQVLLTNDKGEEKTQLVINNSISEPAYIALISDMLNLEPDRRPSAAEVLKRLNNLELPIETDTWPEQNITINIAKVKEQLIGLRKFEVTKERETIYAYEIIKKDGRRYVKSKEELLSLGFASMVESWTPPMAEDGIKWNMDVLKKMFISITPDGPGKYVLFDKRGCKRIMSVNQLVMMKFADKTSGKEIVPDSVHSGNELWEEDSDYLKLNTELLSESNIVFLGKAKMGNYRGYKFKINGAERFMNSQTCKMMRFLIE